MVIEMTTVTMDESIPAHEAIDNEFEIIISLLQLLNRPALAAIVETTQRVVVSALTAVTIVNSIAEDNAATAVNDLASTVNVATGAQLWAEAVCNSK